MEPVSLFLFVMSVCSFYVVWSDKLAARRGGWQYSEWKMHAWELCGGYAGSFLAQHYYKHKINKLSYQFKFWCIVILHLVAVIPHHGAINAWINENFAKTYDHTHRTRIIKL